MKKILSLVLMAALCISLLAGCGSKTEQPETPDTNKPEASAPVESQKPAFSADLTEFFNKIMNAAEEGPFMMDLAADAEMLEFMYPGLGAVETKQLVVQAPAMSAVAIEFAFAEVANAADVETVKTIFQTRINTQVDGGAWYPETIEGWQNNSEIVIIDNYVCLFVCPEKDGMIEAFRNGTEVPAWAEAQGGDDSAMGVDLYDFYLSLCDQYGENFPANMSLTDMPEMLDGTYPGLSDIATNQLYAFQPMMGAVVCEIVLVEVADSADVEAVEAILQARIDAQVDGGAWYPESIAGWQNNSRITSVDNYVMMIAYEMCDDIVLSFHNQF